MDTNRKVIDQLIGRVLTDADFRKRLFDSPEEALRSEGYEPTPEILNAIRGADVKDVDKMARKVEDELGRSNAL